MTEKNKGSNLILIIGALAIMIVTICAFNKERIAHKYFEYTVDKQYGTILTNEYFEKQLEKIREIRLSERKFYQKITDILLEKIKIKQSAKRRQIWKTANNFTSVQQSSAYKNE